MLSRVIQPDDNFNIPKWKIFPSFSFLSVTIVSHISYRKIAATSHAYVAMFCYSSKHLNQKYLEKCLFLKKRCILIKKLQNNK